MWMHMPGSCRLFLYGLWYWYWYQCKNQSTQPIWKPAKLKPSRYFQNVSWGLHIVQLQSAAEHPVCIITCCNCGMAKFKMLPCYEIYHFISSTLSNDAIWDCICCQVQIYLNEKTLTDTSNSQPISCKILTLTEKETSDI